jgi:hypothetical protein
LDSAAHNAVPLNRDAELFEIATGKSLSHVSRERAKFLDVFLSGKAKVVIPFRVSSQLWVVQEWGDIDGSAALPASNQTRTKKVGPFLVSHSRAFESIPPHEVVELGHQLEEVSEDKETPINHPRVSFLLIEIAVVSKNDGT